MVLTDLLNCCPVLMAASFGSMMTNCWSFTIIATKMPKTITFTHLWENSLTVTPSASKMVEFLDCEMPDFMPPCCLVLTWLTFFTSEQDNVHHRSRVANDRTSWDKPVCTHDMLWRQHYIMSSKKYLTNSHILSKYFKFVFLQLHLVNIPCKLIIIWLNYERKKKGAFLW